MTEGILGVETKGMRETEMRVWDVELTNRCVERHNQDQTALST